MKPFCIFAILLTSYAYCSTISEQKCEEYAKLTRTAREIEDLSYGFFPLTGKQPTKKGEFPHMVKLGYEHEENDTRRVTWACGGTLISDEYVLTTASCRMFGSSVVFKKRRSVRAAIPAKLELPPDDSPVKFIKLGDQTKDEQTITVEEIILHPDLMPFLFYNDIALLKLSQKVQFSKYVRPACLYSKQTDLTNKTLIATGWGLLGVGHYYNDDLMKVNLTVFSQDKCKEVYQKLNRTYLSRGIEDSQICVGCYKGNNTLCPGDVGGPFQMKNEKYTNMYDVVSLGSFGFYCNIVKMPILTIKVEPYIPWIENIIWANEISNNVI